MAKAKAAAKPKVDFKQLLLKKGEYIGVGVAGAVLLLLLILGVSHWAGAEPPTATVKDLEQKASSIQQQIKSPTAQQVPDLPPWVNSGSTLAYKPVPVDDFKPKGILFDPVGSPSSKRDNPIVLGVQEYQVDLVRAAMMAYDITDVGGEQQIAVRVAVKGGKANPQKWMETAKELRKKVYTRAPAKKKAPQPGPFGPGGVLDPRLAAMYGGGFGFNQDQHEYQQDARRTETAIEYVALADVDKALAEGKAPAATVVPLRMAVVNATFPYKQQLEEVRRAMRFRTTAEAARYVLFDGFEVKRQVSRTGPDGKPVVLQPWAEYDYAAKYAETIYARKLADHFEGADPTDPDGPFLSYFYRYEDALVMPLPELVPELGKYPPLKLKSIKDTITRLRDAFIPKVEASALAERLYGKASRNSIFLPQTAQQTGGDAIAGRDRFNSPVMDPERMKRPGIPGVPPKDPKNPEGVLQQQVEIDNILVRFVDPDIRPGLTYEYQIRVRMLNPNFGEQASKYLANPRLGQEERYRVLAGPWVQLADALTVPTESFLFAADPAAYRAEIKDKYERQPGLQRRLQAKDEQAVVEAAAWLPEVRAGDTGGHREPVGAWVVAQMPVGRGEYVGKRTFVHLPLWSSEQNQYVFRELQAAEKLGKGKDSTPKGWLVDFSSKSVLVDFEGGKVRTRTATRVVEEEAGTEMLIARPDGSLMLRSSLADAADPTRKAIETGWKAWQKAVEAREDTGKDGEKGRFDRKN